MIFGHDAFRSTAPGFSAAIARQHGDRASLRPMAGGDDMPGADFGDSTRLVHFTSKQTMNRTPAKGGPALTICREQFGHGSRSELAALRIRETMRPGLKKWWRRKVTRDFDKSFAANACCCVPPRSRPGPFSRSSQLDLFRMTQ